MSSDNKKEQLVRFLDRKVFDPVLKAKPDEYSSESDKNKLKDVQQSTRSERDRFHNDYRSAKEVHDNFRDDLSSDAGKKIQRESKDLHLPSLPDVEGEFEQLCQRLGVS